MGAKQSLKQAALVMGLVALAVVTLLTWHVIGQQRSQIAQLKSAAEAASAAAFNARGASMELQRRCAEDARKWFKEQGWKPTDIAGYENHYSVRLNRCFIDFQSTTTNNGTVLVERQVVDVLESKTYGEYRTFNAGDKKYWEVKPSTCEVRVAAEMVRCDAEAGFNQMVRAYMEG
jgi:hypothetical protein